MVRIVLLVSLSISLVTSFCQGAEKAKPKNKGLTLERLTQQVMDEGFEGDTICNECSDLDGTPEGLKCYGFDHPASDSEDKRIRKFLVLLDPSTTTIRAKALCVASTLHGVGAQDGYAFTRFLLRPDGLLRAAQMAKGKLDEKGKTIPGSAVGNITGLDIKAPDTKKQLRRELDFWLKGKGKKKRPEKAGPQ